MTAFAQQSCLISISFRLFFLFLPQSDLLRAPLPFDTVYIFICLCWFHFIPILNVFRFNSAATDRACLYGCLVLFSLCLFTTSSKCTMFTGVVLICGFSLSLSVSLSPSFSIYDSIRIDAYSKDLVGRRLLPARPVKAATSTTVHHGKWEAMAILKLLCLMLKSDMNVQATLGQRHRYVKWWCLQKSASTLQSPNTRKDHSTKDCNIVSQLPDQKDKTESAWKVLYGFF